MSLPDEYDSWCCDECTLDKNGKPMCNPIYYICDDCSDNDPNCSTCHGSSGGHVCEHYTE